MGVSFPPRSQGRSAVGGHALSDASVDGGARREGEGEREREQNPQLEKRGEEEKKERPLARLVVA